MNHRRPMLPRDRVLAALEFRASDVPPLRIAPAPGGLYEHGQKLLDLTKACGHDFGDLSGLRLPEPPKPEDFDPDGRYHAIRTDAWGTTWEYRIFGIWGHPIKLPLSDMAKLSEYRPPPAPPTEGPAGEKARAEVEAHKRRWFCLRGAGGIFEKLCSLRGYEDAVVDIALDTPEINRAADMLVDYMLAHVRHALAVGADAVIFGDDFGTQRATTFSPHVWKRFFKPRYEVLCEPIRRAGKSIFLHSCGQIASLLEEIRALGVNAIWPQLPLFDLPDLARRCRELGLAVELHPDRGALMQRATPLEVRDYVRRLMETFRTGEGGSWLYIEIDPGFPYGNVEALFQTAMEARKQDDRRTT